MACKNCKNSYYVNEESNIGNPLCQGDCDPDIDCDGNVILANCVTITANLACSGAVAGESVQEALELLDAKVCETTTNCTVSVTEDDTCCGYLSDKLVSNNQSIVFTVVTSESGCQKINAEVNPSALTWNNLNLTTNFSTSFTPTYQTPQYSDPDGLGRIWYRGTFRLADGITLTSGGILSVITATLGVNYRPAFARTYFNGKAGQNGTVPLQVLFLNNGNIQVKNTSGVTADAKSIISLDGFFLEKSGS